MQKFLLQVDDNEPCTFEEWYGDNLELSHEEVVAVGRLRVGDKIVFGGGAAAESVVRVVEVSE